jgi:hypothetical protein
VARGRLVGIAVCPPCAAAAGAALLIIFGWRVPSPLTAVARARGCDCRPRAPRLTSRNNCARRSLCALSPAQFLVSPRQRRWRPGHNTGYAHRYGRTTGLRNSYRRPRPG